MQVLHGALTSEAVISEKLFTLHARIPASRPGYQEMQVYVISLLPYLGRNDTTSNNRAAITGTSVLIWALNHSRFGRLVTVYAYRQ